MEKINDSTIVFTDDIDLYLHQYYIQFCNDNEKLNEYILSSNQNTWNGCLIYIYNHAIKPKKRYLRQSKNGFFYDFNKVFSLLQSYIYICNLYDKEINIISFCKLSGIAYDTIYAWYYADKEIQILESVYSGSFLYSSNDTVYNDSTDSTVMYTDSSDDSGIQSDNDNATCVSDSVSLVTIHTSDIYKILSYERENSLSNKLVSGKVNPVGILGVLNHNFGWNLPGVSHEISDRKALSASDLPKLETIAEDK